MGLFSSGQQKQDAADDSGHYTARDDADLVSAARSKRASNAGEGATPTRSRKKGEAADPMLPEKKRARRRLVGAIALALAVAVGLPMILDSEPKPIGGDIAIAIPSKDKAAPLPAPAPANVPASAALDAKEAIVDPASVPPATQTSTATATAPAAPAATAPGAGPGTATTTAAAPAHGVPPAATGTATATKPAAPTVAEVKTAKPEQHAAAKPAEHKPDAKAEAKTAAKEPAKDVKPASKPATSDSERALAILEDKPAAEKPKADTAAANTKIVAQVGAYAAAEKVAEVQGKLRAAGIRTYTEKHGDVTRVRVGPFASKAEADQALAKLEKLGLKGNIVTN